MPRINTGDLISVSDANRIGVSSLVREAEEGRDRIILRNNRPVAAVVSIERLEQLDMLRQLEEDLIDISLATARMLTDTGTRHSLDDVLRRLGHTREQLKDMPD
jgi:antitoxin (DNA-binding transcriptional repressor) of toxin-antitoxin stability system